MNILFTSPRCLIDPSSGAALACKTMLERLAARGHRVTAFGTTVFDRPEFASPGDFLGSLGARIKDQPHGEPVWTHAADGVRYYGTIARHQRRNLMFAAEELVFFRVLQALVARDRPDIVMTFGGKLLDLHCYSWLHEAGIPIVFYLANPSYRRRDTFRHVDVVTTDSEATATLYRQRLGLEVVVIGKFIEPAQAAPDAPHDCVTLVNAEPRKGVAILVGIAHRMAREGSATRFLVVESRGRLDTALEAWGLTRADIPNVEVLPVQPNLNAVWSRTRVLLQPSLWHESGPRTVLEAYSLGIPVLATRSGGLPETVGDERLLFPVPEELRDNHLARPAAATIDAWLARLRTLLEDPQAYAEASRLARARWDEQAQGAGTARLEALLEQTIRRRREGSSPDEAPDAGR